MKLQREEERAELKKKIQKLQDQIQYETNECSHERASHQETQARATALSNELRYGITERRTFESIDEMELVVAHNEMKKVRDSLTAAGRGAFGLATILGHDMEGGDARNRVIGRYFGEHRFQQTKHLFDRLAEELDATPRTDYREWLVHYYEAYNELRRIIIQMADFRNRELGDLDGYSEWCGHDATFLEKIKDIGVMHEVIKAINKSHQYPLAMPGD